MRTELTPSPEGAQLQQVNNNNRNHNTAPANRRWRENHQNNGAKTSKLATTAKKEHSERGGGKRTRGFRQEESSLMLEINQRIELRSRKLTICLLSLIAAISCLSPYVSLHLTQRIGLLLFESDLIQLRSSLYSVIICLLVLVILYLIIIFIIARNIDRNNKRTWLMQKLIKHLIGFFAIISALAYLSLALIVPQIRQIHRMPIATFDCNANSITIENCHQQFTSSKDSEQTIFEAIKESISGNIDGNNERLIKRLNCLKYNDKDLGSFEVPTRFLLHKCGLVCKPQRQQLHQFSDDLNREQQNNHWSQIIPPIADQQSTIVTTNNPINSVGNNTSKQYLVPPYINKALDNSVSTDRHYIYHNASSSDSSLIERAKIPDNDDEQSTSQVSLKVCFSGEFIGGSNYKQFCITNLVNHGKGHFQDQTLTIGQLNAMLKTFVPNPSQLTTNNHHSDIDSTFYSSKISERNIENSIEAEETNDHATHYVNPVVQFESHFKNWPHLPIGDGLNSEDSEDSWCKFRPIPPFIVNNKPFNDIQCSLEHEYTMTTGRTADVISLNAGQLGGGDSRTNNIYLKKLSTQSTGGGTNSNGIKNERRERCNIQCKVNILYKVRVNKNRATPSASNSIKENDSSENDDLHYYLPLKPCVIVSNDGDKTKTSQYYILFRSIGDSSLLLTFIFFDLFILLETIDTKQFQFEAKKVRSISILLIVTLLPLIVAILFDLTSYYYPHHNSFMTNNYVNKSRREGYLITLINEQIVPSILDLFTSSSSSMAKRRKSSTLSLPQSSENLVPNDARQNYSSLSSHFDESSEKKHLLAQNHVPIIDNFILPFFIYAIFMFSFAISSFLIPLVLSPAPLIRVSSTEELGIASPQKNGMQKGMVGKKAVSKQKLQVDSHPNQEHDHRLIKRRFIFKMISLYLICLFMGVQFNLSQHTQTQILIESFGNPAITVGQSYPSLWFTVGTHSSAAIFILTIALIFQNELSSFFSNFSSFKTTASASLDSHVTKQNGAKFFTYLSLSLLIYSFRYYSIAGMNLRNKFKFLVVFLFQIAELFNFPIIWFALLTRAHEMITEYRVRKQSQDIKLSHQHNQESPASDSKALNLHIINQSSLALTYFVIAKSIALFLHSIYVSLHLHSDNVDWFITSFYKPNKQQPNINGTNTTDTSGIGEKSESLFSPLPGERQTYLHASRLFLKYNSLLCLTSGIVSLIVFIYFKFQIWSEHKRTADISQSHRSTDDSIDERLSLDLMRIHSNSTRTIFPESNVRQESSSDLRIDHQKQPRSSSPRAKILFHYNLERDGGSSDTSTSSLRDKTNRQKQAEFSTSQSIIYNEKQDSNRREMERRQRKHKELRIPIQIERANDDDDFGQLNSSELQVDEDDNCEFSTFETTTSKRTIRLRNKRVRIFEDVKDRPETADRFEEDDEQVLDEEEVVETGPRPPTLKVYSQRPGSSSSSSLWEHRGMMRHGQDIGQTSRRKRSISFAPNATLIGEDRFSKYCDEKPSTVPTPKRASPEPSIGGNDDDHDIDSYSDSQEYGRTG